MVESSTLLCITGFKPAAGILVYNSEKFTSIRLVSFEAFLEFHKVGFGIGQNA